MDNAYQALFTPNAAAFLTGWISLGTSARVHTSDSGFLEFFRPRSIAGTDPAQSLTVNTALLVKKVAAVGGRKNRGRMFIPPFAINEASVDRNGVIDAQVVSNQQTVWTAFEGQAGDIWQLAILHSDVVVSPGPPKVYGPNPEPPVDIAGLVVQSKCATQRRRMRP